MWGTTKKIWRDHKIPPEKRFGNTTTTKQKNEKTKNAGARSEF
jgi:hypothetical protein